MRGSRWILLVVILAILAVFIAKEAVKQGKRGSPTANSRVAENPADQVASGGSALEPDESKGTPASAPSAEGNPGSAGGASSGAGQPAPERQSAAQSANPRSAPSRTTSGKKPEGPLPGSKLAECLKSGRPTMADFGKEWCVPCKMMVPVLKQAAQDFRSKANIVFVNLEEYADLGTEYRIPVMPTQIFFDAKGKEVNRHMGYLGSEDIARELAALGVKQ